MDIVLALHVSAPGTADSGLTELIAWLWTVVLPDCSDPVCLLSVAFHRLPASRISSGMTMSSSHAGPRNSATPRMTFLWMTTVSLTTATYISCHVICSECGTGHSVRRGGEGVYRFCVLLEMHVRLQVGALL